MIGVATAIAGVAIATLLAGCASDPVAPQPEDPVVDTTGDESPNEEPGSGGSSESASDANGVASVEIDGRTFEFDLRMCSVYPSGEALISGLGSEVGSDVPSHLDGDSVTFEDGEFRIDIGADGPFQSTDDFLSIGSSLGGSFSITEDGSGYIAEGQAWNTSGEDLGIGTMRFTCA